MSNVAKLQVDCSGRHAKAGHTTITNYIITSPRSHSSSQGIEED